MTRTPIPLPELVADLNRLGQTASVVHNALIELLDGRLVPDGALPNLHGDRHRRWRRTWMPAGGWWRGRDGQHHRPIRSSHRSPDPQQSCKMPSGLHDGICCAIPGVIACPAG